MSDQQARERAEALSCEIRGLLDCHHLVTGAAVTRGTLREALEVVDALLAENERLKDCVGLLPPRWAYHFWHLYRTHPALAGDAADTEEREGEQA